MEATAPAYLVQGFWFQERDFLGLATRPGEGTVAVINRGVIRDMFSGLIWQDDFDFLGDWTGRLSDSVGPSRLEAVHLNPSEFRFEKHYEQRSDSISYKFSLEGDLWVGHYRGDKVGEGGANCVLTPVPAGMLEHVH